MFPSAEGLLEPASLPPQVGIRLGTSTLPRHHLVVFHWVVVVISGCAGAAGECGGCLGGAGEAGLPFLFIMVLVVLGLFTVIGIFFSVLVATMVGHTCKNNDDKKDMLWRMLMEKRLEMIGLPHLSHKSMFSSREHLDFSKIQQLYPVDRSWRRTDFPSHSRPHLGPRFMQLDPRGRFLIARYSF